MNCWWLTFHYHQVMAGPLYLTFLLGFGDYSADLYLELETDLKSFIKGHVSAPLKNCMRNRQSFIFSCVEAPHAREKRELFSVCSAAQGERKEFCPIKRNRTAGEKRRFWAVHIQFVGVSWNLSFFFFFIPSHLLYLVWEWDLGVLSFELKWLLFTILYSIFNSEFLRDRLCL